MVMADKLTPSQWPFLQGFCASIVEVNVLHDLGY
jgi:hypothetical protein